MIEIRRYKYIFILIGALVLFLLGSALGLIITVMIGNAKYGYDSDKIMDLIVIISDYFNDKIMPDSTQTYYEYAQEYFASRPQEFENGKTLSCIMQLTSYIPVLAFIFIFLLRELKEDFIDFIKNFKKYGIDILKWFAIVYLTSLIVVNIYSVLGIDGQSDNENIIMLMMNSDGKWYLLFSVVILAPFIEEIIFRKLFFSSIEKSLELKPIVAIIASSIVFAGIHVADLQNIIFIFQYLTIAVPLCLAYHYSKNIFVSIGVHFLNNFLAGLLLLLELYLL